MRDYWNTFSELDEMQGVVRSVNHPECMKDLYDMANKDGFYLLERKYAQEEFWTSDDLVDDLWAKTDSYNSPYEFYLSITREISELNGIECLHESLDPLTRSDDTSYKPDLVEIDDSRFKYDNQKLRNELGKVNDIEQAIEDLNSS